MLAALARSAGARLLHQMHARDNLPELVERIRAGLKGDLLVLSGGVSAGDLDLVPQALQQCGVSEIFHQVRLKPGKPLWFGAHADGALVFGLPGNPVSSLVCFLLYVRAAIAKMSGKSHLWRSREAKLAGASGVVGRRPTFFPASRLDGGEVQLLDWKGSADLRSLADADCLALLEASTEPHPAGAEVRVFDL